MRHAGNSAFEQGVHCRDVLALELTVEPSTNSGCLNIDACAYFYPAGKFAVALKVYQSAVSTQAWSIEEAAKLHSNISASFAKLGQYQQAIDAAEQVLVLQPSWEKGYVRKVHALICLQQYVQAAETIEQGLLRAKDTASLLEAKQTLLELSQSIHTRKKGKHAGPEPPVSSLQAALNKLQTAGVTRKLAPDFTAALHMCAE